MDAAAAWSEPIPVYAEMGSTNPLFILPGAMAERGAAIAEGLKASVTLANGQIAPSRGLCLRWMVRSRGNSSIDWRAS